MNEETRSGSFQFSAQASTNNSRIKQIAQNGNIVLFMYLASRVFLQYWKKLPRMGAVALVSQCGVELRNQQDNKTPPREPHFCTFFICMNVSALKTCNVLRILSVVARQIPIVQMRRVEVIRGRFEKAMLRSNTYCQRVGIGEFTTLGKIDFAARLLCITLMYHLGCMQHPKGCKHGTPKFIEALPRCRRR